MTRDELTRKILNIKRAKSLSWKTIAAEIGGGSTVYLTAALMGQMKLRPEQAERAVKLLDLDAEEQRLLQGNPVSRVAAGCGPHRPADLPLLRAGPSLWDDLEGVD
jgi:cyanate lyase